MANRKLGKYDVRDRLGRGGMAEVYRAYHSNLDRYVAIKVLHAFLADDPEFKSRFEREAQNVAKLRHPNIVQVYDFDYDHESESYYMVMEMVDGPTLKDWLNELGKRGELMPLPEAIRIIREAAGALAYAHSRSMIHRDVKPANLMLDPDARVVLTDFGIAKIVTGAQFTASGGMVGTPAYMAPEQGLGEAGDERSDLYSLGVILYQLIVGELPYDAETPLAIILKHLNSPVPSVRTANPALPEDLDRIIQKSMAKEPQDRYQTANEFIEDLNRLERGEAVQAVIQDASPVLLQTGNQDTVRAAATTIIEDNETVPRGKSPAERATQRSIPWWGWAGILLGLSASLFLVGSASGLFSPRTPEITLTEQAALVDAGTTEAPKPSVTLPVAASKTPTPLATAVPSATYTPSPTALPSETTTPTPTLTPTPATPIAQPNAASAIIMRTGPGNQYPKITSIKNGEILTVVGKNEDFTWIKVKNFNNVSGWVAMSAVDAFGDLGNVPLAEGPTLTPSYTPTITPSPTLTPTLTPSRTPTITLTPTITFTPSPTLTPTFNLTQTVVFATQQAINQAATAAACRWDYAIVEQNPKDGEDNPVRADTDYQREITLQNTGNCAWEENTALVFIEGESFSAGPRIFIRQRVEVGSTYILTFEGKTPTKGGLKSGTWELRTPDQRVIGEPMLISIFSFEG